MYFTCTSFTLYLRDRQQDVAVKQTLVTSRHSCRNLTNLENNLCGEKALITRDAWIHFFLIIQDTNTI